MHDSHRVESAFDEVAATYDQQFTRLPANQSLRQAVWQTIKPRIPPGKLVLELGCGTGEDALFLARQGIRVIATDISARMVEQARRKVAGLESRVTFEVCGIESLATSLDSRPETFDAILANFGVLNCVPSLKPVRDLAEERLAAGGYLFLCLINRFCLRELFRMRFRRFKRNGALTKCGSSLIPVYYYSPRAFCWPGYQMVELLGLGVFSGRDVRPHPPFNRLGDHYLAVLRKQDGF